MKNHLIIAPLFMPAELRPEEFVTYLSALAAWIGKDAKNLESIFQDFRTDTKSEDTTPARMRFISYLFFECKAGSDMLQALRKGRQASRPVDTEHQPLNGMAAH